MEEEHAVWETLTVQQTCAVSEGFIMKNKSFVRYFERKHGHRALWRALRETADWLSLQLACEASHRVLAVGFVRVSVRGRCRSHSCDPASGLHCSNWQE